MTGLAILIPIALGMGLLGLVAARAGASRVDCVEMNGVLHATACRTLAASGVAPSGGVAVHHAVSTQLVLDPTGRRGPPRRPPASSTDRTCVLFIVRPYL